ncbi:MAG: hypothetical protein Q4P09_02760 [Phascolarctobacterium sp.]|nr:hypothetical protein [Phascolarctobacterium sp.]
MEEICREVSGTNFTRKVIAGIALLLIACLFVNEWNNVQETRQLSLVGWGLNLVLLGLWCWRVSFKYTVILYKDKRLEVITEGMFFIKRSYSVDLTRTESFANKYVRSFFRKTKLTHYIHRYSSLDENPQRLLVFTEGKKNKLAGLIFKCSDSFLKKLQKTMPDKYIQL